MLPTFKRFKISKLEFLTSGIFLILLGLTSVLFVKSVRAQIPPGTQPCDTTASPEFHTFRPYQASPCNPNYQNEALFCGNDLVITDSIVAYRNSAFNCYDIGGGREDCIFEVTRDLDLAIDVSGAEFPIMGRTEDNVINSQNQNETLDDAEKVNEYVSWYLNGVTNAPEYGGLKPNNQEDIDKIVNLSGPIKKLLPHRKQRDFIEEQINSLGPNPDNRHNQVVGCVNVLNQVTKCYPRGPLGLPKEIRLSDWLAADKMPPKEENFPTFIAWWLAYQDWRGQSCISIFGINICIDNPFNPNYWANLYFQIPQSSTEDRKGQVEPVNPAVQPVTPGMTIAVTRFNTTAANLFFSHMEESNGLADILQSTYTPKGEQKTGPVSGVSPAAYCDLTQIRSNPGDDLFAGEIRVGLTYTANFSCEFPIDEPPSLPFSYVCNVLLAGECIPSTGEFVCDTYLGGIGQYGCPLADGHRCARDCRFIPANPSCRVTAQVVMNTVTKTPLADDVWSRLVAGPMGVFKRIFPKVESGAPVEGIVDIPGATGVSFTPKNFPSGVSLSAGNPSNQRSALELYFPHIGGIDEYFLKCIQQALRPGGFGEGCLSGPPPSTVASCGAPGEVPTLPSASGSCSLSSGGSLNIPPALADVISAAAETFRVPPSLMLGIMYGEGAFNPGRYDWTDANVRQWIREGACMPGCDPNVFPSQGVVPFSSAASWDNHKNAVTRVYPNRVPSACNLLDTVFALADTLRDGAFGYSAFAGYSCFGLPLNAGVYPANSCSWSQNDVETSIKVWESGYRTASGSRCWTTPNSCALGTGTSACSVGNGDSCETISNRYSPSAVSHNGCIWDVYSAY